MSEPIKVTLPPWRRGDGITRVEPGEYRFRWVDKRFKDAPWFAYHGGVVREELEYAGPIEFIETEPEPEPLVLECHKTEIREGGDFFQVNLSATWEAFKKRGHDYTLAIIDRDKRTAIETFNSLVRVLQGKME